MVLLNFSQKYNTVFCTCISCCRHSRSNFIPRVGWKRVNWYYGRQRAYCAASDTTNVDQWWNLAYAGREEGLHGATPVGHTCFSDLCNSNITSRTNSRGLGDGWEDNGKFWSKSNLYKEITQNSVRKVTYIKIKTPWRLLHKETTQNSVRKITYIKIKTPGRLLYKEIMQNSGRKVTYIKK